MEEIGSEFWDIPIVNCENKIVPETTQWYLSGRSALKSIVKSIKYCHSVAMPSWCCESMIKPFVDAGYEVRFYPVYWKDGLVQEIDLNSDVLFVMDYFGHTTKQLECFNYEGIVIRDVTHSVFSASYIDADYYFGSLRKWFGFWTGGYAWTKEDNMLPGREIGNETACRKYIALRQEAMQQKEEYIKGNRFSKDYLQLFEEAEDLLDSIEIESADARDIELANRIDIDKIKTIRRRNATILRENLQDWLIFKELRDNDCPMFVPILVPDGKRDALRKHLINNQIYCPVHWPISKYHKLNNQEKELYDNELSVVCDQRYGEEDMRRIIDTIKEFWKEA